MVLTQPRPSAVIFVITVAVHFHILYPFWAQTCTKEMRCKGNLQEMLKTHAHEPLVGRIGKPPGIQPIKKNLKRNLLVFQEEPLTLCCSEITAGLWSYANTKLPSR